MLCHSIYLQVIQVYLFNLGLPMNRLFTFVNQNAICANAVYNVIQSQDISSIRIFCKDIHETLKYVDKKMTKFKKNTHLSLLPLYLSICRCSLIFPKGCHCACTSLSLFLSEFTFAKTVGIQIRPEWYSGKNVSSIKKIAHAIESMQCRTKADAHDKMGFQYISIHCPVPCADPEGGGQGVRTPPPEKHTKPMRPMRWVHSYLKEKEKFRQVPQI